MSARRFIVLTAAAGLLLAGCSNSVTAPGTTTTLLSVDPAGGATTVSVDDSIVIHFSGSMMAGMQQYMDLHLGTIAGPIVSMPCTWSLDLATVTCKPTAPLAAQTQYTIHMGGGMMDGAGHIVDLDQHGPAEGGQWMTTGMMGGMHGGQPTGMMGAGWMHAGFAGMGFTFTTS